MLIELFDMCCSVYYNERQHGYYYFWLVVARNTQQCPYQTYQTGLATAARKGKRKAKGKCLVVTSFPLEVVRGNIADDGHCKIRVIRKTHQIILLSLLNLMTPGPILAVYCMQLSPTIACPFSKYFQILYIFAQIFKYFALFQHFFVLFLKNCYP